MRIYYGIDNSGTAIILLAFTGFLSGAAMMVVGDEDGCAVGMFLPGRVDAS